MITLKKGFFCGAVILVLALLGVGCGPSEPSELDLAVRTIRRYAAALQDSPRPGQRIYTEEKQLAGLKRAYSLHADSATGESEEQFITNIREAIGNYLVDRDLGEIAFDPYGAAWIYASQMENGAWVEYLSMTETTPGLPVVRTRFRFGYHAQTFEDVIPGIIIYMLGDPPGTIYAIELGSDHQERPRQILREVYMDIHLMRVQDEGEAAPRFVFTGMEPVPGTAIPVHDERFL